MVEITISKKLSTNQILRLHYHKKTAYQNDMNNSVHVCCKEQKIEPITEYPMDFRYEFYLLGNSLDTSNTSGMQKVIEDGLRYAGILKDDSRKFVGEITLVERDSKRNYNYCIVTWKKKELDAQEPVKTPVRKK